MSYFDGPSGPSTNYAQSESRIAWLSSSRFAASLAQFYFGLDNDILQALVGRYSRGKRKGLLRGFVQYDICTHGGWVTGRGIRGRGIFRVALCVADGWDGRHREVTSSELLTWERQNNRR